MACPPQALAFEYISVSDTVCGGLVPAEGGTSLEAKSLRSHSYSGFISLLPACGARCEPSASCSYCHVCCLLHCLPAGVGSSLSGPVIPNKPFLL